jgi:DNA-binding CsgD family transcriptional regulator
VSAPSPRDAPPDGAGVQASAGAATVALALAAYLCMKLRANLINGPLFGLVTVAYPFSRDLTTIVSALVSLVVFAAAFYRPATFARRGLGATSPVLALAGLALLFSDAAALGWGWPSVLGSALLGAGSAWLGVLSLLGCCSLGTLQMAVGVPLAMGAGKVASQLAGGLVGATAGSGTIVAALGPGACGATAGQLAAMLLECACVVVAYACGTRAARPTLERVAAGPAVADASITHPSSYLPLTSTLFVSLFLLKTVHGFELRFDTSGGAGSLFITLAMTLIIAAVGALDARRGRYAAYDGIFSTAVLFVMLAFLVVPIGSHQWLASDLLAVSTPCINLLLDLVLISAARGNPLASVSVISFGDAIGSAATTLGANVGALAGSGSASEQAYLASAAVAGVLLAYVLFAMRDFSFGTTILGIEPVRALVVPDGSDAPDESRQLGDVCAELAADHGLSPRESDVLELLARGRNNAFIQEELVLTRNTVKSHIRHIYTKLGVHSQQELIDLVDDLAGGEGPRAA